MLLPMGSQGPPLHGTVPPEAPGRDLLMWTGQAAEDPQAHSGRVSNGG